jgi:2-polyprenyl-3-methyl-5-hydroxy-6-metoxy-1,4-benzoquinol methylase
LNRYNFIAPLYDLLKRIVFGKTLDRATSHHVKTIQPDAQILVVGGGTGAVLKDFGPNQTIQYVDSSSSMILRAQNQVVSCHVTYHHTKFEDFKTKLNFDTIILPFFLDQFNDSEISDIISTCNALLNMDGILIVSDFKPIENLTKWYQKLLLKTVIVFFTITTRHRVRKIFNSSEVIQDSNFQCIKTNFFYSGMVFASIWKKTEH